MYTGNTICSICQPSIFAVYPCVYREHYKYLKVLFVTYGLSLCIQGTLTQIRLGRLYAGFIPVYTGNTNINRRIYTMRPVYPCVYREHANIIWFIRCKIGLSLCIQGTPTTCANRRQNNTVYPCVYREHR